MGRKGCLSDLTNVRGCAEFPVCKRWWFAPAWYRDKCLFKMQGSKKLDLCEDRQARSDSSLQAHLSNKAFIFIAVLKKLFSKELWNIKSDNYVGLLQPVYTDNKNITKGIWEKRDRLHYTHFMLTIQFCFLISLTIIFEHIFLYCQIEILLISVVLHNSTIIARLATEITVKWADITRVWACVSAPEVNESIPKRN